MAVDTSMPPVRMGGVPPDWRSVVDGKYEKRTRATSLAGGRT